MEKQFNGYTFSRKINGQFIPQRVQNLVIQNYEKKYDLGLYFSSAEYYMENCYTILNMRLKELNNVLGLIFYSTELLPQNKIQREKLYEKILNHQCSLHFALEELVIRSIGDIQIIEDIMICRDLTEITNYDLLGANI